MSGSHSLSNNIVSVALSQAMGAAGSPQSHQQFALGPSSNGSPAGSVVIHQGPGGTPNEYSFQTSPAGPAGATSVTVDLPSIQQQPAHHPGAEGNEVLLCNLDDLSRYIPGGMENFYSDFNMADQHQQSAIISSANLGGVPDYLQTVVAGKAAVTTTVSALPPQLSQSPINLQSHQQIQQQLHQPQTITVHLPTQVPIYFYYYAVVKLCTKKPNLDVQDEGFLIFELVKFVAFVEIRSSNLLAFGKAKFIELTTRK